MLSKRGGWALDEQTTAMSGDDGDGTGSHQRLKLWAPKHPAPANILSRTRRDWCSARNRLGLDSKSTVDASSASTLQDQRLAESPLLARFLVLGVGNLCLVFEKLTICFFPPFPVGIGVFSRSDWYLKRSWATATWR